MNTQPFILGRDMGTGWILQRPDFRDITPQSTTLPRRLKRLGLSEEKFNVSAILENANIPTDITENIAENLPQSVDLKEWCSPVISQGHINSCTACAGISLMEYFERRALGEHMDASRLFLYKTTRTLMQTYLDIGADLRNTLRAMAVFGVPPEKYWPYFAANVNKEPPAFCYAFAQNYQTLQYVQLDVNDISGKKLLARIKSFLHAKIPAVFGFSVYDCIEDAYETGVIPYPGKFESSNLGHAIMAVGYHDTQEYENRLTGKTGKGAIKIMNSWGNDWGEEGYGWLPYPYITGDEFQIDDEVIKRPGITKDWWTILKMEWIENIVD